MVKKDFHHGGRGNEDGASVNEDGRSRSNAAEISVLALKKESETVTDGSGWAHSSAEVVVSVEGRVEATGIAPTEVQGATRPTPKPPDPNSLAVVKIEATSCKVEGRTEAVTGGHSGAADGFVTEGKRGTLMAHVDGDATVTDGSLRAQLLRRSVLLTPPPLLAAVFPWDRGGGGTNGGLVLRRCARLFGKAERVRGGCEHCGAEVELTAEASVAEREEAAASSVSRVDGDGRVPRMAVVGLAIVRQVATEPAPTAARAVDTATSPIAFVGGRFLQEVPSNLLGILGWGRDIVIRVGTADFIHYGNGSKTSEEEVAAWVYLGFHKNNLG